MHNGAKKHSNAVKHGVFAEIGILDWENRQEFTTLHAALEEEWVPVGPTEHDAVLSIAKGKWRKRRIQWFLKSALIRCKIDPTTRLTHFVPFPIILNLRQTHSMGPSGDFPPIMPSICDKNFRKRTFNPFRNGFAQSGMRLRRSCCRRRSVSTGSRRWSVETQHFSHRRSLSMSLRWTSASTR
jgi:hypothetical protein